MLLRFYSLAGDDSFVIDGPYESIQITYDLIRDEEGRTIASRDPVTGAWSRAADGRTYSDIVVMDDNQP